ncbi:MAG: hypothetical protein K2Z25_12110, partial [Beijerinckiaceae bacterium]|nr:hypothetical protein [Beijerinckiaceae bacterium]
GRLTSPAKAGIGVAPRSYTTIRDTTLKFVFDRLDDVETHVEIGDFLSIERAMLFKAQRFKSASQVLV